MFKLWCEWGVSESSLETGLLFVLGTDVLVTIREPLLHTTVLVRSCLSAGVDNIFLKHFNSKPGL